MIAVIILAAGESKRMGQPKMLLPWGGTTVLGHVIDVFQSAGIKNALVVTGGTRKEVELVAKSRNAEAVFNKNYANGEMLSSIQCGLRAVSRQTQAALIALGDQPQVEERSVRLILEEFSRTKSGLIVPSYQMRRGHPWLVARQLWQEILEMKPPDSTRDFLNKHAHEIRYIETDTPTILQDLDTPEDYLKSHP
jgi:molybdenum cofactor cytidylyltransferase